MIQDTNLIFMTYFREDNSYPQMFSERLEEVFKEYKPFISSSIDEMCNNIFKNNPTVSEIDITIRLIGERTVIQFIDEGDFYNPYSNDELIELPHIKRLEDSDVCEFEYTLSLGFNKYYFKFNEDLNLLEL